MANCATEEERTRTAELIRPILRGRDIKRYGYDWADLWLINTHNGIKGKLERIHIENYPAVKAHLDQYWDRIKDRADQGDTPYNLRNCAYLEEFFKPKIIYTDIAQRLSFSYSGNGEYLNNSAYFFSCEDSTKLQYLLKVLNSDIIDWYYRTISVQLGEKAVRMFSIYVLKLPIPLKIIELNSENDIYELFGFSIDEIRTIQDRYN